MNTYCKANCEECNFKENCKGCQATCGSPFGGKCVAAEYIKVGGYEAYKEFKEKIKKEVNELLTSLEIPETNELFELAGSFVNLSYPLPSGEKVKLLNDKNIYLGCQIECDGLNFCYGVVADSGFIMICSYSVNGSEPELVLYKKR
ncbi:MAG: DUF3795 domain-containing protein [Ruminococcus sp.]|nr:DUF3795 domain-containing protein [Candidatus Copronaster equi]